MSKNVSSLLTLAALAAVAAPVSAQHREVGVYERAAMRYQPGGETQTERTTRTVKIGSTGDIDISNISGDITITRGSGKDATIEIVKTARARTAADAREMLGQVAVNVNDRGGRVEIQTVYPQQHDAWIPFGRRGANVSVAFTIAAPAGVRVSAKSLAGAIRVAGIKGELTLESVAGGVRVSDAGRISSVKSMSGAVEIVDSKLEGPLEIGSVSDQIVLRRVRVRSIEAESVSGGITLDDTECDRVQVRTFSGSVEFTGPVAKGGRYEMKSHSGDVRVTITGGAGFEIEATTFSGSLRSDFPLTNQEPPERMSRGPRRRSLKGVFGDGSAVLELTTFSGSVVLSKR
jgi:DUF4097 and DUF4098 domain-containing protein YvlB